MILRVRARVRNALPRYSEQLRQGDRCDGSPVALHCVDVLFRSVGAPSTRIPELGGGTGSIPSPAQQSIIVQRVDEVVIASAIDAPVLGPFTSVHVRRTGNTLDMIENPVPLVGQPLLGGSLNGSCGRLLLFGLTIMYRSLSLSDGLLNAADYLIQA